MYFATKRPNTVNYHDTIDIVIVLQLSIMIVIVVLSLSTNKLCKSNLCTDWLARKFINTAENMDTAISNMCLNFIFLIHLSNATVFCSLHAVDVLSSSYYRMVLMYNEEAVESLTG